LRKSIPNFFAAASMPPYFVTVFMPFVCGEVGKEGLEREGRRG